MNDSKYSRVRQPNFNGGTRNPRGKGKAWGKLHYNVGLVILAGVSALVIMFGRESSEGSTGLIDDFKRVMISSRLERQPQLRWNHSSYSFKPNVSNWDEQRATWTMEHPSPRARAGGMPNVMMVTGSSPKACDPTILSHLFLRSTKNKLDYSRIHDIELFYNLGEPDENFSDWWVKLPVIRMLMLQHPQVEWIWWLDADAVITDMSFEPPYAELEHDNLVVYGEERNVYDRKSWTGLSTANFMIRNCQWSLDLLAEWASMGTTSVREEAGNFLSELLTDRPQGFLGDDQSSLVALLALDKRNPVGMQRWAPIVKLVKETEYSMAANWTAVGPELERLGLPGHGRVPFVTHFAGCLPSCNLKAEMSKRVLDSCVAQLGRAFDFADNQIYKEFGFEPRKLGDHLTPLEKKLPTEGDKKEFTVDGEEIFRIFPRYADWDERRLAWMQKYPPTRRDEVILVSGSAPKPCSGKQGSHLLLRGLKNLIDYGRKNEVIVFYNNAAIDENLTGWWSKLPLVRMLMLGNPGTEWIWWLDSDAVITDMDYRLDFARYNASGYNIVMYGDTHGVYDRHSFTAINTGNFVIRNCQWSLDLFDRWASFGATPELRVSNEDLINEMLPDRPRGWDIDDQSVLAMLLFTEREKWGSQSCLETAITMSGAWQYWIERFTDESPKEERPFVTHYAGCKPCQDPVDPVQVQGMAGIDKTYTYADNQVLQQYGLRHVHLNSTKLLHRSSLINETQTVGEEDRKVNEATETESEEDTAEQQKVGEFEEINPADLEKVGGSEEEEEKEVNLPGSDSFQEEKNHTSREKKVKIFVKDQVDGSDEEAPETPKESAESNEVKNRKADHPEKEKEESQMGLSHVKMSSAADQEDVEVPEERLSTTEDAFRAVEKPE